MSEATNLLEATEDDRQTEQVFAHSDLFLE